MSKRSTKTGEKGLPLVTDYPPAPKMKPPKTDKTEAILTAGSSPDNPEVSRREIALIEVQPCERIRIDKRGPGGVWVPFWEQVRNLSTQFEILRVEVIATTESVQELKEALDKAIAEDDKVALAGWSNTDNEDDELVLKEGDIVAPPESSEAREDGPPESH